jgi:hypothetical protein
MKYNGVPIDRELMEQRKEEAEKEMDALREKIAFIIGDVNIGSNCSTMAFKNYLYHDLGLPVMKTTGTDQVRQLMTNRCRCYGSGVTGTGPNCLSSSRWWNSTGNGARS